MGWIQKKSMKRSILLQNNGQMTSRDLLMVLQLRWPCGADDNLFLMYKKNVLRSILKYKMHCPFTHCLNMSMDKRLKIFTGTLDNCNCNGFSQIGAILPASVATSERSFSYLWRLKTYLRDKTGEERLNGLMLLHSYKDVEVTYEEVIDIMAKVPRRQDIVL